MLSSNSTKIHGSQHLTGIDLEELQTVFRRAMASVATPVSVVTALKNGNAHGSTVSAFASLSMNPPMVMVALDRNSDLLSILRETGEYGVNLLGDEHSEWASAFARKGPDKFTGIPWTVENGLPRLPGACWIACSVESLIDGGDHVIVLGSVLNVDLSDNKPLTYCQRTFGTHAPIGV
jgi:flavin reductase (DIM6/NTAB) family NADH-FMN oxidoreductase RutF